MSDIIHNFSSPYVEEFASIAWRSIFGLPPEPLVAVIDSPSTGSDSGLFSYTCDVPKGDRDDGIDEGTPGPSGCANNK